MRLFSWYGLAVILVAAGCGYVAGVGHRSEPSAPGGPALTPSREEESIAPPPGLTFEGLRITPPEEIDLTCPPNVLIPFEMFTQTHEPPLASLKANDSMIRQATFEFPAGSGSTPSMPYLHD